MKYSSFYILCLLLILNIACNQKNEHATLLLNLKNAGIKKLELFNIEKEIHHSISGDIDSISMQISNEIIIDLSQGRSHSYIHLKSGDNLTIDTLSSKPILLGVSDSPSKENKYLVSFANTIRSQSKSFSMRKIAMYKVDSFILQLNQKYIALEDLITTIIKDDKVSTKFKSAMQLRLLANKGNDLLVYKDWYNYLNKAYPELPSDFYNELDSLNFTDAKLMIFEEGRKLGVSWASRELSYDDYTSDSAYFAGTLEKSNDLYGNTLMGNYCNYDMVFNQINFGSGIDGSTKLVEDFKSNVSNKYLNNKIDETLKPWLNLKSGLLAPDFKAFDRDSNEIQLTQLKGKKVYIDVWATWCGPCIKEIPFLKKLEKELHDENIEFVSVSIDQLKDKQKWLDFIKKEDLKGLQLMANNDWKSDIATTYNIKGIPRFLLIDEKGHIISANAPRPSDPKIKNILLKL